MSIRNDFSSDNNNNIYYSAPPGGWGTGDEEEINDNVNENTEQQKNSQQEEQLPRNDFAPVRWVNSQESQPSSSQQQEQQLQQQQEQQKQQPQASSQDDNRLFLQEQEQERQKILQQQSDEKKRKQAAEEEQEMQRLISLIAQEEESRRRQQEEDQRRAEEEEKRRQRQQQDEEDEMQNQDNRQHQHHEDDEEYYESVERDILHQDDEKEARISAAQDDDCSRKRQQEIDAFDDMQRQKKLRREQEKDYERRKMQFKLQQLVDLEFANIEESEARRRFVAGQDQDFARLLLSEFEQRHAEENKLVYTGYLDQAIFSEDDRANNFFDQFSCLDDEEDDSDFEIRRALFVEHALDLKKTEQQLKFQALMSLQIQSSRTMLWFTSLAVKLKTEWLEREARWVLMTGFYAMKLRIKKRKHFSHNITKVQREFVEEEQRRREAAKTQAEVRAVQSGVLIREPRTLAAALQVILIAHETRHEIMKQEKQAREKFQSQFKASHFASTMHDLDREQLIVQAARQQRKKRWEQMDPFLVRRRMPVVANAGMVFVPAPPGSRGVSVANNFCGRSMSSARPNTSDSANGRINNGTVASKNQQTQRDLFPQISNKNNSNRNQSSNNTNLASSTNSRPQTSGSPAVVRNVPEGYRYAIEDDDEEVDGDEGNARKNRQLILRRQQQQQQQQQQREEEQRYNGNNIGTSERAIVDQENYVPPSRASKSQQKDRSYARGYAGGYDQQWYPYPPGTEKSRIQPNQKSSLSPSRSNTNNEDRESYEESNSYQRGSHLGNQQNDENNHYYSTSTTTTAPGTKKLVRKSHEDGEGNYPNYNQQRQRPTSGSMNSQQSSSQNPVNRNGSSMNSGGNSHRSSNNNNNNNLANNNSRTNSATSSMRPGTNQSQQLY